ncbi:uncharacterized protein LOC132712811 [Ruditapes philippinarum]|uniref:uncharacterized protein LOC132712811 n=1 Tax=Ruditapes philippinarum TaxID=129788 RepID=UPI00295B5180|nr:uncharacterized protein LOC132712811 [Ruditapes philippinarum]
MGKKDKKVKKEVFPPICDKHPKYTVDLFCVDCDKVICVICQATEHNSGNHKRILTIEKASTDCVKTEEFEDRLNTVITRADETLAENNEVNETTNHLKEETESLINKHKQELIDLIETHHKILYEKNQVRYEQSKKRLQSVNKQLCINKNKAAEIRQEIKAKKESGQNVALFIALKQSQDNLQQIEMELEEIEKSNFVERYEFQAGHVVGQLLKEEKEFGDLLVMASASTKEPPRELKHRGVFVLPRQSSTTGQAAVADEDEHDDYENVEKSAGNGSDTDQSTQQEPPPRSDSTQSLNTVFTEETNKPGTLYVLIVKIQAQICSDVKHLFSVVQGVVRHTFNVVILKTFSQTTE